jgi:hypothetical protein
MQDSLETLVHTLGGVIVSPSLGSAELLVAVLVAFGFMASAVHSIFAKGDPNLEWWER